MIIVWVPGQINLTWYNVTLLILGAVIGFLLAEFVIRWLGRRW